MPIDAGQTAVDGSGGFDLDARWQLELLAVIGGDQDPQLMAPLSQTI